MHGIVKLYSVPYMWNCLRVKYLATLSENTIGEIFDWWLEYCMKRNPCLQPKWHTFNLAIFTGFAKPPN